MPASRASRFGPTIGLIPRIWLSLREHLIGRSTSCKRTLISTLKIRRFLKENIKDFSSQYDCVLVADVCNDIDIEIGTELGKEKSIDIIMNRFKH